MKYGKLNLSIAAILMTSTFSASAFTVVVKNNTGAPIMPFVMSLDGLAPDSVNSWILAGNERVYDKRSSWLDNPSIFVHEGSTHEMLMGTDHVTGFSCGEILFEGAQEIIVTRNDETYELTCEAQPMAVITNDAEYNYRTEGNNSGFIIQEMKNEADIDRPVRYADGPQDLIWSGTSAGVSTYVTVNAVNNLTGSEHPIVMTMRRSNHCTWREMNTAVGCSAATTSDFNGYYEASRNGQLPSGKYSGVTKIGVKQWKGTVVEDFNLGFEITKE